MYRTSLLLVLWRPFASSVNIVCKWHWLLSMLQTPRNWIDCLQFFVVWTLFTMDILDKTLFLLFINFFHNCYFTFSGYFFFFNISFVFLWSFWSFLFKFCLYLCLFFLVSFFLRLFQLRCPCFLFFILFIISECFFLLSFIYPFLLFVCF